MERKTTSGIILALLLTSILASVFEIQPARASATIYIRTDGNVDPPTAPIQRDGNTYTFTNVINDSIVVERDNITIDGANYTLQRGPIGETGIDLSYRKNVAVANLEIRSFHRGILLNGSSNNEISGNLITDNEFGLKLVDSTDNIISGNTIENNECGIILSSSADNGIHGNKIGANLYCGIDLGYSSGNKISGNKITASGFDSVYLGYSSGNTIHGNKISGSGFNGIRFYGSSSNTISKNNLTANNEGGIFLEKSRNNSIYHNNFVDNTEQVYSYDSTNSWEHGNPSGGNYWSDYEERYPNATEIDATGIWDTPYVIDEKNRDHQPLVNLYTPLFGDLNDDREVDFDDVLLAAGAFGSYPGHSEWNPAADLVQDGVIDIFDIVSISNCLMKRPQ